MGSKNSKSRKQSKVIVHNQGQKPQDAPQLAPSEDERQTKRNIKGEENGRQDKLSTKTEISAGLTRGSELQASTGVAVECSISKNSSSCVGRPPPRKEQHEIQQVIGQTSIVASNPAAADVVTSSTRNSSSHNDHDTPLSTSMNATDGYVSFSESESGISTSSRAAATTATTPVEHRSPGGTLDSLYHDNHNSLAVGEESQQDQRADNGGAKGDGENGDDMWDFGDEDSDDEQDGVVATVGGNDKQPSNGSSEGVVVPESPTATIDGGGNYGNVDEPQHARVVVDRLGRRENAPRRWVLYL